MTETEGSDQLTRREMLVGGLRYVGLAAVGAGGWAAAVKRQKLLREGKCLDEGVCPGCSMFARCGHPRARSIRKKLSEGADD